VHEPQDILHRLGRVLLDGLQEGQQDALLYTQDFELSEGRLEPFQDDLVMFSLLAVRRLFDQGLLASTRTPALATAVSMSKSFL